MLSKETLLCMKYPELQKLAKSYGIKANAKANVLVAAIEAFLLVQDDQEAYASDSKEEKTIEDECRMNVMSITQLHLASEALSEKENNITTGYADTQVLNTTFEIEEREEVSSTEVVKPRSRCNTYELKQSISELSNCTELSKENVEETNKSAKRKRSSQNSANKIQVTEKQPKSSLIPCRVSKKQNVENNAKPFVAKTKVKDWGKIHQKQFEKMEDIDDYLDRKTKRAVGLSKTVTQATPKNIVKKSLNSNRSQFQSPILSTKEINLNFAGPLSTKKEVFTFQGNPNKKLETIHVQGKKNFTPLRESLLTGSIQTTAKKSICVDVKPVTPFTFKGNQSELNLTIGSTKKKFDLQASLAKPITWRMHKGPLKPLGEESKNHASPILHKTDVKKAKVASREERRQDAKSKQTSKRFESLAKRRAIN